jgi:hypothetical protein
MESAALTGNVSDAVNAHFQESLRLASQKVAFLLIYSSRHGMWSKMSAFVEL